MRYYVDTCIWLNILKKEKRFWKSSLGFIINAKLNGNELIISTIVLKELKYKIGTIEELKRLEFLKIVKTKNSDYSLARDIENLYEDLLSFYDYLHIAVAKRLNAVLITRDNELRKVAGKYVKTYSP